MVSYYKGSNPKKWALFGLINNKMGHIDHQNFESGIFYENTKQ